MSVLRYYVCITLYSDPCGPWLVISDLYLILSLVLCCDIHRSTLISIMYPACMINVHDRKSRALERIHGLCRREPDDHPGAQDVGRYPVASSRERGCAEAAHWRTRGLRHALQAW